MIYKFKRSPYNYQARALRKALSQKSTAIIFDPGLGKTKVAVDFAVIKLLKENKKKVVIICPLSAMGVWDDEWYADCPDDIEYLITPLVGKMPARIKKLKEVASYPGPQVVIMTFDTIKNKEIMKIMLRSYRDIIIIDELHHCKNISSGKSKATKQLRDVNEYALGLTGTLMPKNPLDVISQYNILNQNIFGSINTQREWWSIARHYADFHPTFKSKPIRWYNMDELQTKILSIAVRAKDTENPNLPDLIIKDIPVILGEASKNTYKQMAEDAVAELESGDVVDARMAAVKAMKLHQITGGFLQQTKVVGLDEDNNVIKEKQVFSIGDQEKLEVFKDLVLEQLEQGHKIIVACAFLTEISAISAWLEVKKIGFRVIKGGVSGEKRAEIKREFQSNKDCKVIVFQISAATSMTLTAGDVGILYSTTYKWDDYFQWLKRLHRAGQTRPVRIFRLIAKGTIDKKIIGIIETKQSFTDVLVDKQSYKKLLAPDF